MFTARGAGYGTISGSADSVNDSQKGTLRPTFPTAVALCVLLMLASRVCVPTRHASDKPGHTGGAAVWGIVRL